MTSIPPIRIIKARTRVLVPLQKPVFNRQNKTHRAGNWTDAHGEVVFFDVAAGLFERRLGLFVAVERKSQSRYRIWSVQNRSSRCSDLFRVANSSFEMPPTCSTVLTSFS